MTEFLSTHEPATGALITELPIGDAAREVAIARAASIGWAMTPLAERIATLQRFAGIVRERAEAFARALLGEPEVYKASLTKSKEGISPDGSFPADGAQTALKALLSYVQMDESKIDLSKTFTNEFVKRANEKYANG